MQVAKWIANVCFTVGVSDLQENYMSGNEKYLQLAAGIQRHDWDEDEELIVKGSDYEYHVTQFQGTAFASDYQCYKVAGREKISGKPTSAVYVEVQFVVKISNMLESKMLSMLHGQNFPVPFVGYVLGSKRDPQSAMLFESFVPGQELFQVDTVSAWKKAAETIAEIHAHYWNLSDQKSAWWNNFGNCQASSIFRFEEKISNMDSRAGAWKETVRTVREHLEKAPKTLVHGDLFPTNILLDEKGCWLIDWANAGEFPYFMDIGRLTGIIREDTERMCKYEAEVCKVYYGKMQTFLNITYEEFLKEVYMGQFIECANTYIPPHPLFGANNSKYNTAIKARMDALSSYIL